MANQSRTGAARDERAWTVMVYMGAGDSAEMDEYAVRDLREMERGANKHVHVAVQVKRHWPEIPQRYVISNDGRSGQARRLSASDVTHTDMGDPKTLISFLEWAVRKCPARHYMLVLWGHAYGLGFGRDHGDPLRLTELVQALDAFRKKRVSGRPQGEIRKREGLLDILGTNACAMSYVEAAYELRDSANYLLASQIYVPFAGWPYNEVLQTIGEHTEPDELGRSIVESYVSGLNNSLTGERVQMSLLDLSRSERLRVATANLAAAIRGAFKSDSRFDSSRRAAIRDTFLAAAAGDVRPLIDLKDLARGLERDFCDSTALDFIDKSLGIAPERDRWLKDSAERLKHDLNLMNSVANDLIVTSAAHPDLAELGGLGIYVPFVTDEQDLKRLGLEDEPFGGPGARDGASETNKSTYENLAVFAERDGICGTWPALVYEDLNEPIPSELLDLIADIGVTGAADRAEIAQIVLSIESTFNKLDRVLDLAQTVVTEVLRKTGKEGYEVNLNASLSPRLTLLAGAGDRTEKGSELEVTQPILREWFKKLEAAVEEVERTTKKGLTQARFGLGPLASPRGFSDAPIKHDYGVPARSDRRGFSDAPIKHDFGPPSRSDRGFSDAPIKHDFGAPSLDVIDGQPEVYPAFILFSRAADALRRLEQATLELERQAGQSLGKEVFERSAPGLRQAFGILRETATSARRTIRRVIANPAYGIGPGPAAFDRDDREELANAAGMSARNLLLLSVNPLAPEPVNGLVNEQEHEKNRGSSHVRASEPVAE